MNLFDFNKQIFSSMPLLSEDKVKEKENELTEWQRKDGNYFLLYNKEVGYFTLFEKTSKGQEKPFGQTIVEILLELGGIVACDYIDDTQGYEIWLRNDKNTMIHLILFNWDGAMVKYHG